jgi:hypothetical protein
LCWLLLRHYYINYGTINLLLIEFVYPFPYIVIMAICHLSCLLCSVSTSLSRIVFALYPNSFLLHNI